MHMMRPDFEPLEQALEKAKSLGASDAEAYFEREAALSIRVFDRKVEEFSFSESRGIGVRVYAGDSQGRSFTSELSDASIEATVKTAMDAASVTPPDAARALPDPSLYPAGASGRSYLGEELDILGGDLETVPAKEKIEFTLDMERRAREHDPRISGVETSAYSEGTGEIVLANSRGFRAGYRASICFGYVFAIAEEGGETQTGFGFTAGRSFEDLDAGAPANEASGMAVDLLGGRQVASARVPVLFDNLSTAEILAVLGSALSADSVVKGRSFLADRLGRSIASGRVTVVDDALLKGGFGTAPFDAEGVASSRKALLEAGELKGFLHNCYTARRMEAATTGNAGRGSYKAKVGVAPTNILLEPGGATPAEMRAGMSTGFEVRELIGVHVGLNPVTGEVSLGAKGRWIEGGEPVHAVREVTIAGTIEGLLKGVVGIGDDLRFTPMLGGVGAPSVLVEGLTIGGT